MDLLVLPDCPSAQSLARMAMRPGVRAVSHASGRPWLIGQWADEECMLIRRGPHRLALFGGTRADVVPLARTLENASSPHALDAVARRLPGSCHLVASLDGRIRAQGSIATARQIFHARVGGVTIAAASPGTLTPLMSGVRLDEDVLALHLLLPVPWPLFHRSVWAGIEAVGVGRWLDIRTDGTAHEVCWWTVPEAGIPLAEAAGRIRDALVDSVAVRAAGQDVISADLSGGLDSTSLCFLAQATGTRLLTHHLRPRDRSNTDTFWARRAADLMPSAQHRLVDADQAIEWFEAARHCDGARDDAEGPMLWIRNRAQYESLARTVAADGSHRHLVGIGGDQLFGGSPQLFWSLIRSNPLLGLRTVRRFRPAFRWPLGATVRALADRRSFARALADAAAGIDAPLPPPFAPLQGWGQGDARMPAWATGVAVSAARRVLLEAAASRPEPLHPDRLQHQTLEAVVASGHGLRRFNRALQPWRVQLEAPFLDDRVIEATLCVRAIDRARWGSYKPVLTTALGGTVPDAILARTDKGHFGQEAYEGLYHHRQWLADLCADLRLAERGLVDAAVLRRALHQPMPDSRQLGPLENTLACETWLRSPSSVAPSGGMTPHADSLAGGPR